MGFIGGFQLSLSHAATPSLAVNGPETQPLKFPGFSLEKIGKEEAGRKVSAGRRSPPCLYSKQFAVI